ncbi:hypothetical protein CerSpe_206050 [Prunus speciosa]
MEAAADQELPSQITCFEILPRLPSKSLMRFKCVCKSWSSLTRNPSFVNAHRNLGCNKHTHLFLSTLDKSTRQQHFFSLQINQQGSLTPSVHLLSLPMPRTKNERLYLAQSINGLVCLHLHNTFVPNQTDPDHPVRVFNPCTRESIALPHASPASHTAHVTHHFGFSPLTNEYKVLQVQKFVPTLRGNHFMFKIFKLGTSSWRNIELDLNDLPSDPLKCPFDSRSLCVNGVIHWLHATQNVILVFDIVEEKFRAIPYPKDYNCFPHLVSYIIGVDGRLALVADEQLMGQDLMGLWILRDYQNQVWLKETITLPFVWREVGYPLPCCTIHTGELLFQSSGLSRHHPAYMREHLYNMKTASFRAIDEIVLPPGSTFLKDNALNLLASYEDNIVSL